MIKFPADFSRMLEINSYFWRKNMIFSLPTKLIYAETAHLESFKKLPIANPLSKILNTPINNFFSLKVFQSFRFIAGMYIYRILNDI